MALGECSKNAAKRKSCIMKLNTNMKHTAIAGFTKGITMVDQILKSPAPSIRADSRISLDIVMKWFLKMNVAKGAPKPV